MENHIDSILKHPSSKSHVCSLCTKSFFKKNSLFFHQKLSHPNWNHNSCDTLEFLKQVKLFCESCDIDFNDQSLYTEHNQSFHSKLSCNLCSKRFKSKALLAKHKFSDHGIALEITHQCSICNKTFSQLRNLTKHQAIHNKTFSTHCSLCNKSFATPKNYMSHVDSISHIKLLAKKEGKSFDIEKTLGCSICNAKFHFLKSLEKHLKRIHDQVLSFKCVECNASFNTKTNLKRHMNIHTDKKDFRCDKCGVYFRLAANLKDHCSYVHSEKRDFSCKYCEAKFKGASNLKRHLLKVHKDLKGFQNFNQKHFIKSGDENLANENSRETNQKFIDDSSSQEFENKEQVDADTQTLELNEECLNILEDLSYEHFPKSFLDYILNDCEDFTSPFLTEDLSQAFSASVDTPTFSNEASQVPQI